MQDRLSLSCYFCGNNMLASSLPPLPRYARGVLYRQVHPQNAEKVGLMVLYAVDTIQATVGHT